MLQQLLKTKSKIAKSFDPGDFSLFKPETAFEISLQKAFPGRQNHLLI